MDYIALHISLLEALYGEPILTDLQYAGATQTILEGNGTLPISLVPDWGEIDDKREEIKKLLRAKYPNIDNKILTHTVDAVECYLQFKVQWPDKENPWQPLKDAYDKGFLIFGERWMPTTILTLN